MHIDWPLKERHRRQEQTYPCRWQKIEMMTNLTKNEICSLFEGTKAWFDKSLQWTVTADVRLLLECFRLELKADFDKLLLQLGAGSLFKQRPGEFIGIAPNLWRIWGFGGFVEELRRIYRKRSNHEMRADLTLAAARQSRERIIFSQTLSTLSSDGRFADFSWKNIAY